MTPKQENEFRELDCWIAEHVMGWHKADPYSSANGHWVDSGGKEGFYDFAPATDPAAAMAVLEKCAGVSHNILIYRPACDDRWCVAMDHTYKDKEIAPVVAETLPLAICRFAKALFAGKDL